jgi:hypothetical protein
MRPPIPTDRRTPCGRRIFYDSDNARDVVRWGEIWVSPQRLPALRSGALKDCAPYMLAALMQIATLRGYAKGMTVNRAYQQAKKIANNAIATVMRADR